MIPLYKVYMPQNIQDGVNEILYSGQLSSGQYTKQFEKKIAEYIDFSQVITLSCNPISFVLSLIGIKEGDEIIASPMSCLATTLPIKYAHANVVWADIDPNTGSLNPEDVKKKITSKTKAIIHYHWGGYPGYIDEINKIAVEKGIYVIEDASETFGSEYKGKKIGNTNSDFVCFAFTPVRLPNSIDGSGVVIKNKKIFEKALLFRDFGIDRNNFRDNLGEINPKCDIKLPANGVMLNNLFGYIGSNQMDYIDELYLKQRENAICWNEYFKKHNINVKTLQRKEINPNYWVYTILAENRDELLEKFREKGYYASKMHLRNDLYSVFNSSAKDYIGVNEFYNKQLNIPCGWWVNNIKYGK